MSQQSMIDAAKAPTIAYGKKDWDAARAAIAPDFFYDEVATHRKMEGVDQVIACWKEWATAFPDSTATFHNALVSGNTVVVEVNEAVYQLNHRPRKCLQYRTPHEVFFGLEIRPIKLPEVALCT